MGRGSFTWSARQVNRLFALQLQTHLHNKQGACTGFPDLQLRIGTVNERFSESTLQSWLDFLPYPFVIYLSVFTFTLPLIWLHVILIQDYTSFNDKCRKLYP